MDINFWFEVMGDFNSDKLWGDIKAANVNLLDLDGHVYVYGTVTSSVLVWVILTCGSYGNIKGGEFECE